MAHRGGNFIIDTPKDTAQDASISSLQTTVAGLGAGGSGFVYKSDYSGATAYAAGDVVLYSGKQYQTSAASTGVAPGDSGTYFYDEFSSYADGTPLSGLSPPGYTAYGSGLGSFTGSSLVKTSFSGVNFITTNSGNKGLSFNPGAQVCNADFTIREVGAEDLIWYEFVSAQGTMEGHSHGHVGAAAGWSGSGAGSYYATGDVLRLERSATYVKFFKQTAGAGDFVLNWTVTLTNGNTWSNNTIAIGITTSNIGISRISVTPLVVAANTWAVWAPFVSPAYPVANGTVSAGAASANGFAGLVTFNSYSLGASTLDTVAYIISCNTVLAGSTVMVSIAGMSSPSPLIVMVGAVSAGQFALHLFNPGLAISGNTVKVAYRVIN